MSVCILAAMLFGAIAFADTPTPKVQINGVTVYSDANHVAKDRIKVDVDAFFEVLGQDYAVNTAKNRLTVNGKSIYATVHKGKVVADLIKLSGVINATKLTHFEEENLHYVLVLPPGVIQLSPVVPKMGEHWANPGDLPVGPVYGVYNGKLVFTELLLSHELLNKGENVVDIQAMKGLPSPPVLHTDVEFVKNGHEAYPVSHYMIHNYFITPEEQNAIGTEQPATH